MIPLLHSFKIVQNTLPAEKLKSEALGWTAGKHTKYPLTWNFKGAKVLEFLSLFYFLLFTFLGCVFSPAFAQLYIWKGSAHTRGNRNMK